MRVVRFSHAARCDNVGRGTRAARFRLRVTRTNGDERRAIVGTWGSASQANRSDTGTIFGAFRITRTLWVRVTKVVDLPESGRSGHWPRGLRSEPERTAASAPDRGVVRGWRSTNPERSARSSRGKGPPSYIGSITRRRRVRNGRGRLWRSPCKSS